MSSEDVEPITLAPEFEALAYRALASRAEAALKMTKATLSGYDEGDKRTFRSPVDGRMVGQVYRTDPDPAWVITDKDALTAELSQYPGCMETVKEIAGSEEQVI